jgi:hypothetical protein
METIKLARARTLAGLAAMLLGSVAWSGTALAQDVSNPTTSAAAANTNAANADVTRNAATANAAGRGQNNNSGGASSRAPTDPGVRGGDPGAGGALPGLSDVERQYFDVAKEVFQEVDAAADGLGPTFNLDSCSGCHSQPTIGGTSPATNPQVAVATLMGAKNVVPSFITANGPIREARFVRNRDGSPDGGVHGLFVITGRSDAPGCNIAQPNFAAELARNNVVFRIPTPVFGLGLVENISDGALEASLAANAQQKRALGISGRFNRNGNDGTIARFGWKAQNKSLLLFSGEAYNVEMGITNELFQNERNSDPACQFKVTPNDSTPLVSENTASPSASFQNDIDLFAAFMRFSAPPTPASAAATPVAQATGASNVTAGQTTGTATGASTSSPASTSSDGGGVGHGGRFERDGRGCGVVYGAAVVIRLVRCFGHPREPGVFQCRLSGVSHQDLHDREIAADGAKQRDDPALQRLCPARNGNGVGGRRFARDSQWQRIPNGSAVGRRPTHLFPS